MLINMTGFHDVKNQIAFISMVKKIEGFVLPSCYYEKISIGFVIFGLWPFG